MAVFDGNDVKSWLASPAISREFYGFSGATSSTQRLHVSSVPSIARRPSGVRTQGREINGGS